MKQNEGGARTIRSGFTLIELMAVIVVIAVAMSLGGGMAVNTHRRLTVEKGARDILELMRYGRVAALERQCEVTLMIDRQNGRAWLEFDQAHATTGALERVIIRNSFCKPVTLASAVTFERVAFMGDVQGEDVDEQRTIRFLPNGSASEVVVQVGNGSHHYSVGLNAVTGRPRLYVGESKNQKPMTLDLDRV